MRNDKKIKRNILGITIDTLLLYIIISDIYQEAFHYINIRKIRKTIHVAWKLLKPKKGLQTCK